MQGLFDHHSLSWFPVVDERSFTLAVQHWRVYTEYAQERVYDILFSCSHPLGGPGHPSQSAGGTEVLVVVP